MFFLVEPHLSGQCIMFSDLLHILEREGGPAKTGNASILLLPNLHLDRCRSLFISYSFETCFFSMLQTWKTSLPDIKSISKCKIQNAHSLILGLACFYLSNNIQPFYNRRWVPRYGFSGVVPQEYPTENFMEEQLPTKKIKNKRSPEKQSKWKRVTSFDIRMEISKDEYAELLQKCGSTQALAEGKMVHAHMIRHGFVHDVFVRNHLTKMYLKCGSLQEGRQVFDKMPKRNVFSWTVIIAGFVQHGCDKEAMELFSQMVREGAASKANEFTFTSILTACSRAAALDYAKRLHVLIIIAELEGNVFVGGALVAMYSKCGCVEAARKVFDKMPERDTVVWNLMIEGYAQNNRGKEAVELFHRLHQEGINPDIFSLMSVLSVCVCPEYLRYGEQVHARTIPTRLNSNILVENALVTMYIRCGDIEAAKKIFDRMPEPDLVLRNIMIAGYVQHGRDWEAVKDFCQLQRAGVAANEFIFASVLTACTSLGSVEHGKRIHACITKTKSKSNVFVANALVNLYAKCGCVESALKVFDEIPERNAVLWNSMILGYALNKHGKEAVKHFHKMQQEGWRPDKFSLSSVLSVCSSPEYLNYGEQVHAYKIRAGLTSNLHVENALITMYARCGRIDNARRLFKKMARKDVVSWTAIIAGYIHQKNYEEALKLFCQMQGAGTKPNLVTFSTVFNACERLSALGSGNQVFAQATKTGFVRDINVVNALLRMYAVCGSIEDVRKLFSNASEPDLVTWNAMISGYAQHGYREEALQLFEKMQYVGAKPDSTTFLYVTYALKLPDLINEGRQYLSSMSCDYGME